MSRKEESKDSLVEIEIAIPRKMKSEACVDKSGTTDYIEYIIATMHRHKLEKEEKLIEAFKFSNKDRSGFCILITVSFFT
ncbi:unnamed protein product [Arabidopsis lyrata]|uniref:Predicted protein n=1 Tax=Arabidopsis lyrata subsp. lyrata TaxID=81972 RepID=D7MPY2_ARALL|nr:predicted protein [Arabidopsis lyrata subsp. lyrata]CAH8277992.1 unnamed protein product [Arabidopsis lyrata]